MLFLPAKTCTVHTRSVQLQPQSSHGAQPSAEHTYAVLDIVKVSNAVAKGGCAERLQESMPNGLCNEDAQAKNFEILAGDVRDTMLAGDG